jgi:hypothetical protein
MQGETGGRRPIPALSLDRRNIGGVMYLFGVH